MELTGAPVQTLKAISAASPQVSQLQFLETYDCSAKYKGGKKSFMYFSSSTGKGFIVSDDEEITGVISVRNKSKQKKRTPSFRNMISDTINDTLKRKKKPKPKTNIADFLFVSKPHFSSDESIERLNSSLKDKKQKEKLFKSEVTHMIK